MRVALLVSLLKVMCVRTKAAANKSALQCIVGVRGAKLDSCESERHCLASNHLLKRVKILDEDYTIAHIKS